jgi:chorismate dehydratase
MWGKYTGGLPFVFAAWVSNQPLPDTFLHNFNTALKKGLDAIPELIYILPTEYFKFDLKAYFTQHISFNFDDKKKEALSRFLKEMDEVVITKSIETSF